METGTGSTVMADSAEQAGVAVSVIVTCFNQERWIAAAVQSVLQQTLAGLECIVVDDGSADGSAAVVQRLQQQDSRIRLVRQSNQGVSAARNAGFELARGSLIQFLDGDDLLQREKLRLHAEHFQRCPDTDVSWCDHEYLDDRSGVVSRYPQALLDRQPLEQMLGAWFDGVSLPIHAAVFRRSLWSAGELPFPVHYRGRCEDWVFLVSVALKRAIFSRLDGVLCVYRVGAAGFTSSAVEWNAAALRAAVEIAGMLPPEQREAFLMQTFRRTLDRCVRLQKPQILRESTNWRIGYVLTRPWFLAYRAVRTLLAAAGRPVRSGIERSAHPSVAETVGK